MNNKLNELKILNEMLKPSKELCGVFLPKSHEEVFDFMFIAEMPSMNEPADNKKDFNFNVTARDKFFQNMMVEYGVGGSYVTDIVKERDIPRAARGEKGEGVKVNSNNRLLEGTSMYDTGFDFEQYQVVSDKFWQRMKEARIHKNDFVFTRTGASLGQSVVITEEPNRVYLVNGALDIIRFNEELNPFYAVIFIMSNFGQMQVERIENGVGQPNLSEDELYQILIPNLSMSVQKNIESEYKKMSKYHDKAMEAKKNNDEAEYKKNIEIAEEMLKDLIMKTEAVIRGEKKDIL